MTRHALVLFLTLAVAFAMPISAQQAIFHSSADAVLVPVSVTDKNKSVAGLTAADFQLLDNGVPQEFALTTAALAPTDFTFLVDTSGSLAGPVLDRIKADVRTMANLLQPNDRVRLVTFTRQATDVFGLQPAGATLPLDRVAGGGTTSLYDALAAVLLAYPSADRPHMIFAVTDGRDTSSFTNADEMTAAAKLSTAVLFVGLIAPNAPAVSIDDKIDAVDPLAAEHSHVLVPNGNENIVRNMGPYRGAPNETALKAAAAATGGLVYDDPSGVDMPQLFRRVLDEFRASYVLTYTPRGVPKAGPHAITVKTRNGGYVIRARKGYDGG